MRNYVIDGKSEIERLAFQSKIDVYDIKKECDYFDWSMTRKLLDVGCGSGNLIYELLNKNIGEIHGLDMSEERIKYAQNRLGKFKNVTFHLGAIENQKWESEEFDTVVCRYFFEHVINHREILSEIKQTLKSSGQLFIINFDDIFFNFTTKNNQLNSQLKELKEKMPQDFEIGRKLPQMLKSLGFSEVNWNAESFFFKGERLQLERKNTEMRLAQGRQHLAKYFSTVDEYDFFSKSYLEEMKDENNVLMMSKYLISAKK